MSNVKTEMENAAYAMVEAYKKESRMIDAVDSVAANSKMAYGTLLGMWQAIDAWNDLNT